MSCASSTCSSRLSIDYARGPGDVTPASRFTTLRAAIVRRFDRWRKFQLELQLEKARQRKTLLELDDRLLRDIGVTREEALREGRKAFWE